LSFDSPLFIRILELAREDVKEDMELHRITERLLSIRKKGVMTMDGYEFIAGLKKLKEGWEELDEVSMSNLSPAMQAHVKRGRTVQVNLGDKTDRPERTTSVKKAQPKKTGFLQKIFAGEETELTEGGFKSMATDAAETKRLNKMSSLQKFRADADARTKKHDTIAKNSGGMTSAIDRLEKHLTKENTYQDSYAATQTTGMEIVDLPADEKVSKKQQKQQMSKSARIIKALYKKKGMKESADGQSGGGMMYDKEKTDKPETTYGKKPTVMKAGKEASTGDNAPQAAAILSGGKTLTGQTRDTLEIDPLMKKPGPPIDQNKKAQDINKQ
jgi:hypothetical protein